MSYGIEGTVYAKDGTAVAVVGRPAIMQLQLTGADGALLAQSGVSFIQRILDGDSNVLTQVASTVIDGFTSQLVLDGDTISGLYSPPGVDLTHTVVAIRDEGEEAVFTRPFAIRAAAGGVPAAIFTVTPGDQVVVRYEGGPGLAGLNAYELAVQQGFVGSLDLWLEHVAVLRRDIVIPLQGSLASNELVPVYLPAWPLQLNIPKARARARIGPEADWSGAFLVNGSVVGHVALTGGASTVRDGVVTFSPASLADTDDLYFQGPATPSAQMRDLIITLPGNS